MYVAVRKHPFHLLMLFSPGELLRPSIYSPTCFLLGGDVGMNYWIVSAALFTALGLSACNKPVIDDSSPVPVVFPMPAIPQAAPKEMWNLPEGASKPIGQKKPRVILVEETTHNGFFVLQTPRQV